MRIDSLADIQQQLGQTFPPLYHQLQHDGMLDWGTFGHGWVDTVYPALRAHPPLLLSAGWPLTGRTCARCRCRHCKRCMPIPLHIPSGVGDERAATLVQRMIGFRGINRSCSYLPA